MAQTKRICFCISIQLPVEATVIPVAKSIVNTFDLIGDIVSLKRNDLEDNVSYKQRLMDVNVHPGGPTYPGIINSITRDLGLERKKAITISLKVSSAGEVVAENPRIDFLANRVILYHDWQQDGTAEIDKEIRYYQPEDTGYFISDLVDEINTSDYFTAVLEEDIRPNLHSSNLIRRTSDSAILNDLAKASNRILLVGKNIMDGSLIFSETTVFATEVEATPAAAGEYLVDKTNGRIEVYSLPSGKGIISYHCATFPMEIDYSEIRIYSLQDEDFTDELYQQEEIDSGEEVNVLLNTEGTEILHQLYKDMNMFWGV